MTSKRHPPTFSQYLPQGLALKSVPIKRVLPKLLLLCLLLVCLLFNTVSFASDLAKEKRWIEEISDSLMDGDAIQLSNGSHDFLAIDTQADDANELGVIVLHGKGVHPDWPEVIQPLRVELAEAGWNTVSLQLPVLSNDAEEKDYDVLMSEVPVRIDAGIRHLSKQGAKKVAIVAHSMGAKMASYYLSKKKVYQEAQTETPIVMFISIGLGADQNNTFSKVKIPVFDVLGENDFPIVMASASERLKLSADNKAYKQMIVAEANHFFEGQNEALLKAVTDSLKEF